MSTRRRSQRDIEQDIQEHLEMETRENIERGMPPADARLAALRKFGNPLRVAEETRAVWRWMWADRLLQDARYALRGLRRNPSFAAVALGTFALGIGMNTAVFSVISAVLIKPLPYPAPDRLVWLANYYQPLKLEACTAFDFADWRSQAHSFDDLAAYGTADRTVRQGAQSAKHPFVFFTPNFWQMAGAHAALGRLFTPADRDVVVLSWRVFEQRFGADPGVVGRVVEVDGRPSNIIGVLPRDFRFLPPPGIAGLINGDPEVFSPMVLSPEMQVRGRNLIIWFVVGRLKAGVSIEAARAELQAIQAGIARNNPAMRDFYSGVEVRVTTLQDKLVGASRRALWIPCWPRWASCC